MSYLSPLEKFNKTNSRTFHAASSLIFNSFRSMEW